MGSMSPPKTMKAWRYEGGKDSFHLRDHPVPEPKADEVLVQVQAAGLCHSDCHIVHGDNDHLICCPAPITLGHETSGTIVQIGSDIKNFAVGDNVVMALITHPQERFRIEDTPGLAYDGGYGQHVIGRETNLLKIPAGITFGEAAVATDCLATAYHAVVDTAGAKPGLNMAILGLGGLGLAAARYAVLQGANVYGFEINTSKHEIAKQNGVKECFKTLSECNNVVFDVIVDFVGITETLSAAVLAVKDRGTIVTLGLGQERVTYPAHTFVSRALTLKASLGGSLHGLEAVLGYIASGEFKPNIEEIPYEGVAKGLQRLDEGKAMGRLWANPSLYQAH